MFSITLFRPAPSEAPTNNWGVIPITDPKKKLLILTLNNVGKMFEIKKGILSGGLRIIYKEQFMDISWQDLSAIDMDMQGRTFKDKWNPKKTYRLIDFKWEPDKQHKLL